MTGQGNKAGDSVAKPTVRTTVEKMLFGRASAEAPIVAVLAATIFRMVLEGGTYFNWTIDVYPMVFAQQLTFYAFMFVSFAAILKIGMGLPFERVTNVASVGLFFSVLPPVIHVFFFPEDSRATVYFREMSWSLFESNQASAESVVLWMLIASTALFVGLMTRSWLRALGAGVAAYGVIVLLIVGVLQVFDILQSEGARTFAGYQVGSRQHGNLLISTGQAGAALLLYFVANFRTLWPSLKRLNHAFPHVAIMLCGAAWVGEIGWHRVGYGVLLLLAFFVLLVQNDYFDRKEDELAGRAESSSRSDMLWVSFLYLAIVASWFTAFSWACLHLVGLLVLGLLYHHPALRLKTRFCLSYMVEGGWAALAFSLGTAMHDGPVPESVVRGMVLWFFLGGALLSMLKDWKDYEADRDAGVWTMYVTFARKWNVESVHKAVTGSVVVGLLGFGAMNAAMGGVHGGIVTCAAALAVGLASTWADRRRSLEFTMYLYTLALLGAAWSFYTVGAPGILPGADS